MNDSRAKIFASIIQTPCLNIYDPGIASGRGPRLYRTHPIAKNRIVNWAGSMDICTRIKLEGELKRGTQRGEITFRNRTYLWSVGTSETVKEEAGGEAGTAIVQLPKPSVLAAAFSK